MNIGHALISSILDTRDIRQAITGGVTSDLFDYETAQYWEVLLQHYDLHSEVPSLEYFKEIAPGYKFIKPQDTFSALLLEAKTQYLGQALQEGLVHVSGANGADPWVARDMLVSLAEKMLVGHQTDDTLTKVGSDIEETLREIEEIQNNSGVIGLPWPWDYLNEKSLGFRDEELYYIYGREGTGKTFLNLWLALHFWAMGKKVLFFTREAGHAQLKWRIIALMLRMPMRDVMKGQFTMSQYDEMVELHKDIAESNRWYCSEIGDGMTGFKSVVEQINPDIVIHDYFKSMADDAMGDKTHSQHTFVARIIDQIKDYAMRKKVPIIITGHANRKGVGSDGRNSEELAWSDHIARRCDFVIRLITDPDIERTAFIFTKARGMEPGISLTFDANKCERFGDFISLDTTWIKDIGKKDKEEKKKDFMQGDFKF